MNPVLDRRGFLSSAAALLVTGCASGQLKIPGLSSSGNDEGGGGGNLIGQSDEFQKYASYGTKNLLVALAEVGSAVERKEEAARYQAVADAINGGSISVDTYKKANGLITNSTLKPEDLVKATTAKSHELVKSSFIHFSIGGFADRKASSAAQGLLAAKPTTAELANGTVSGALLVARVGVDALPTHVAATGKWIGALTTFMKANKIKAPSAEESKKVALAQGMPPELLKGFEMTAA